MASPIRPVAIISDPVQLNRNQWVDRQMSTPAIGSNAVTQFLVQSDSNTGGVDVSFSIVNESGIDSVSLLRAEVLDIAQAIVLQSWSASASKFTWSDTDKLLQQMGEAYYWVQLEPVNGSLNGSPVTVGPQYILLNPSLLPPQPLTSVSASHAAASNGTVLVTCNVSTIDIKDGDAVKIYVTGYQGNASPVAVASHSTAPLQFALEATGETVTITAIAVSSGGAEASTGPTCTLVLNGTATVPAQVQDVQIVQISTGNQVEWPASLETGVTGYSLYRGQRLGGFGAATLLASISPAGTGTIIYLDTGGLGGDYEYYVTVTTGAGTSAVSNAANPQVLFSSAQVPANSTSNTFNNANIDSIDAGSSVTIRIYGAGGVGTGYQRLTGYGNPARPAGTLTGLAYTTQYYIIFNLATQSYQASTTYSQSLPDGYEWVGTIVTVAVGGSGGGGTGGTGAAASLNAAGGPSGPWTTTNVTITNPGAGYGSATATCSTFPSLTFTVVCSGGKIVNIYPNGSTSAPSAGPFGMTITSTSPYLGGGGSGAGARYVLSS